MMWTEDPYCQESIMVHEFAHTVMNCGFTDRQHAILSAAYRDCQAQPERFEQSQYWMCNEEEFWAEMVQAWFSASIRVDVNSGINTRPGLKDALPILVPLLTEVFGGDPESREWSYKRSCPRPNKW